MPQNAPKGDQDGGAKQLAVATAMANAARAIGSRFVLALGDNFYWQGVESVKDPLWKSVWEDRFNVPSLQTPWSVNASYLSNWQNLNPRILACRRLRVTTSFTLKAATI